MNGWFMVGAAAVALGLVLLWLGRESRTREPQYWDDGSVLLPCDANQAAYACGCLSIGTGVFAFLLGNQPSVSRIDSLFFALWCVLLVMGALALLAASRTSASFTPTGISLQHPLWSVQIPWSSFSAPGAWSVLHGTLGGDAIRCCLGQSALAAAGTRKEGSSVGCL